MSSFTPAPTVLLPRAPDQHFANSHYVDHDRMDAVTTGSPNVDTSAQPNGTSIGPLAGRKRSRGDVFSLDDGEEERLDDGSGPIPRTDDIQNPEGNQFHSPANQGRIEEHAERMPFELSHMKRPSVTSRKSQRMDSSAPGSDDLAQLVLPPQMREVTSEPLIDEATRSLGISWTRMDSTEVLLINQAAYGKWIQNHYPGLKDVSIWFENSALPGYLVAADNVYNGQHEYYIFSHDLTEARLVTTEPSQLLPRLKMLPALHLAAPGGHIRAETDPVPIAQKQLSSVPSDTGSGFSYEEFQPTGACAAHAMEME